MSHKIEGIFCPHVIPLDHQDRLNESELRRIIDFLIERGITGIYPNGSTGEFTRMTHAERRRIIEIVQEQASRAGRDVPVLAGAYEANIEVTLDALNYYADLGCRAGALIAPHYYKMSQENVRTYFEEVADRAQIDIVLYNIPQFSNEISIDTIEQLCQHPRIIGIKDSSRDMPRFLATINRIRPKRSDFSFLVGCEEILLPTLMMGGDGGTIATSGVVPEVVMKLYNLYRAGHHDEAIKIQYQMLDLIDAMLNGVDFPEGFRSGMAVRGFDMGRGRQHQSARSQLDIDRLTRTIQCLIAEHGLVSEPPGGCEISQVDDQTIQAIVSQVVDRLGRGEISLDKAFKTHSKPINN